MTLISLQPSPSSSSPENPLLMWPNQCSFQKCYMYLSLNTVREILCTRCRLALNTDLLQGLASSKKYRDKRVVMATRSLIQLFRIVHTELLRIILSRRLRKLKFMGKKERRGDCNLGVHSWHRVSDTGGVQAGSAQKGVGPAGASEGEEQEGPGTARK